jgi:hypothetical protein
MFLNPLFFCLFKKKGNSKLDNGQKWGRKGKAAAKPFCLNEKR